MGLWDRISGGLRNTVQRIPGGSQAFPTEANGTVNWLGNPLRGDNVLGAAFRGASGIDAAETVGRGITGMFGRDNPGESRPAPRPGSVVGRGYLGRNGQQPSPSQYGPRRSDGLPRVNAIGDDTASGVDPRAGNPSGSDVIGEDAGPSPMRGGVGGYNGQSWSGARGLGEGHRRTGDQTRQEAVDMEGRMRSRNGLMAER